MQKHILVMDAHAVGMVGVVRSLGRAGYFVVACASSEYALGLHSRYASAAVVHPAYASGQFEAWLDEYLRQNTVDMIVPSEGFLHAVCGGYERFSHLLPDAVPRVVWQRCMSKIDCDALLRREPDTARNLPFSAVVTDIEQVHALEASLQSVDSPYYVKCDEGKARDEAGVAVVRRCPTGSAVVSAVTELLPHYEEIICQGYAPGRKVGVSLWRHNGEILAESMTIGIHMNPFHGGMMSLRETFWHEDLLRDAKRKLTRLDWEGVAMMEYKWDPVTDRFWFIEINARYWGYLHLDLLAGKDFPRLQADAFFGPPAAALGPPPANIRCRYLFPGDVGYLMSLVKSRETGWMDRIAAVCGFFGWSFDPQCHADLWFRGDRALYWRALLQFMKR